jgi:hypothetical protein
VFAVLAATALACAPVPGLDLLKSAPARILWFGEIHGTNEQPALFGDIVCNLSAEGHPLVVVLERSIDEQAAWTQYLKSRGLAADVDALATGKAWTWKLQDGRSGRATLRLAERLRRLFQAGRVSEVRLMIPRSSGESPEAYERSMGEAVARAAAAHPNERVLVLSGNLHAQKSTNDSDGVSYRLAANFAPDVVSINIESGRGTVWNCQPPTCGPHSMGARPTSQPRGVTKAASDDPFGQFDFVASTGTPTTASLPAKGDGKPVALDPNLMKY